MTSFPGLLSPVTSEGFLLKSSISPCPSVVQPHPKASADSSIRTLPIACLTARRCLVLHPVKEPPTPTLRFFPTSSLSFSFPSPSLASPEGFELLYSFSQDFLLLPRLPPLKLGICLKSLSSDFARTQTPPHLLLAPSFVQSCRPLFVIVWGLIYMTVFFFHSCFISYSLTICLSLDFFQMLVFDIHLSLVGFYRPSE